MRDGDIIGHEGVGTRVSKVQPGGISAVIACGNVQSIVVNSCDTTNPSKDMDEQPLCSAILTSLEDMMELKLSPYADTNLLHVTDAIVAKLKKLLLLFDVACTGWHACELSEVGHVDVVGIWVCKYATTVRHSIYWQYRMRFMANRGALRIIAIDSVPSRLKLAQDIGAETINIEEVKDILDKIRELVPKGFDVTIDAVGFRYASKSMRHKVEKMLYIETYSVDVVDEVIKSVKKAKAYKVFDAKEDGVIKIVLTTNAATDTISLTTDVDSSGVLAMEATVCEIFE
ncbi:10281_t:CDS:2 [Paraglomus brasilianum]|uniref:10281_t:CDS:1 n=1 Tax=Paraglomus brasilianum TaxID=144538 RepID=A0A9N8WE44_9GLOM|nr:10281_t:CDS:2 [Paraglomus brasilianum]